LLPDIPASHSILEVVNTIECSGPRHLQSFFEDTTIHRTVNERGQGIIVRNPKAWYFEKDSFYKREFSEETILLSLGAKNFKWPNGTTHTLDIPDIPEGALILVKHPLGKRLEATFVGKADSRADLYRNFFCYTIAKSHSGSICRGCAKRFEQGSNLCIQTQLICILPKFSKVRLYCRFCGNTEAADLC
jgi:hypothetical protein